MRSLHTCILQLVLLVGASACLPMFPHAPRVEPGVQYGVVYGVHATERPRSNGGP